MRKVLSFFVLLCLLAGFGCAFADEIPEVGLEAALEKAQAFNEWMDQRTAEQIAEEMGISVWSVLSPYGTEAPPEPLITVSEGDSWDGLLQQLLDKYDTDSDHVGIGYYFPRTGEEHYINPDKYIVSASMFKVPLNMILADRVSDGEMTMDTDIFGMPYRWYQYRTIVHSDNERSVNLMDYMGGYSEFKRLQIPYLGNDPSEDLGWNYQIENYYNAREFIHLLRMLYDEPERFPGIVENMLEAEPYSYFHQYERRYPIAQKYGFVGQEENWVYHTYINTCGIIFTEDPFLLVVFTDNVGTAYDLISECCMVMCDYTNLLSAKADRAEAQAAEELRAQQEADRVVFDSTLRQLSARIMPGDAAAPLTVPVPTAAASGAAEKTSRFQMSVVSSVLLLWIAIAMIAGFVIIFRHNMSGKINAFWAVLAILLAGGGLALCVVGFNFGLVYAKPEGNPQETVTTFFDSLIAEDYPAAYACLNNYSTLGLENTPESEESRILLEALKQSYGYALRGDAEVNGMKAVQKVSVVALNLKAIRNEAEELLEGILQEMVDTHQRKELYDADGNYLPSVTNAVTLRALLAALNSDNVHLTSAEFDMELVYTTEGKWLINAGNELLSILCGGAV